MNEVLERLLQAHVRHELSLLQDEQLDQSITSGVAQLFAWLQTVTMNDVVTRAQIDGVIERYVIELRVSGGITELAGECSQLVMQSRRSVTTRVQDILPTESFAEFADKLMSLESVRRELISLVARSSSFAAINARILSRSLLDLLTPAVLRRPGVAASLKALWEPLLKARAWAPDVERRLSEVFEQYVEQHRERITHDVEQRLLAALKPESIRTMLDEIWDDVADMPLAQAFAFLGEQDLEDFIVLGHEFWLRYRKSEFFRGISAEMVDHLFAKYGDETLASLIEDMGVAQEMVSHELIGFLRPILQHARHTGALEAAFRAKLSSFYTSEAAVTALTNE